MNHNKGVLLAASAAALFATAAGMAAEEQRTEVEALVHCAGINACKQTSECRSATNACKGQNSCKGAGWISVKKSDCEAQGGKVVE
jgi:hypothetical protein